VNVHADAIQYDFIATLKMYIADTDYWIFQSIVPVAGLCVSLCNVLTVKFVILFHTARIQL